MPILTDLVIILAVSAVALFISTRLKLPSIVGFLVAGLIVGPAGLEWISSQEEVKIMAEIGILLLLFAIGIEFSLEKLIQARRYVLLGGTIQVLVSMLIFAGGSLLLGLSTNQAIFIGMLFALSSTAIVLQLFQEKGWMNTPFGKASVSILIFQDIIIIPMMLAAPYLFEEEVVTKNDSPSTILLGLLLVIVVVFAARKVIPPLIRRIVHTHNQELFLITIIIICFATALITNMMGLKLALGAFLAGLIISESEYSYEALKNIMPFKKIFTALFFVSVGMLMDFHFIFDNFLMVVGLTLLVMLVKFLIILPTTFALKIGLRSAIISGLALCQVGEFAFILSKVGLEGQILSSTTYQIFLSVSILSMILSAIIISSALRVADGITRFPWWQKSVARLLKKDYLPSDSKLSNHTVIIGFGPSGKRVTHFLHQQNEQLAVIELNDRNIDEEDHQIAEIIVGDGSNTGVLHRAAIELARQVIITVPEAATAEDITIKVRKLNQHGRIIVRTKYEQEITQLQQLGADKVIPEETSVANAIMSWMNT